MYPLLFSRVICSTGPSKDVAVPIFHALNFRGWTLAVGLGLCGCVLVVGERLFMLVGNTHGHDCTSKCLPNISCFVCEQVLIERIFSIILSCVHPFCTCVLC